MGDRRWTENTDRWELRVAAGGQLLAAGEHEHLVQLVALAVMLRQITEPHELVQLAELAPAQLGIRRVEELTERARGFRVEPVPAAHDERRADRATSHSLSPNGRRLLGAERRRRRAS